MKLAIYSILTVIAMTGSTYANQCGDGTADPQAPSTEASSSQSTEDKSEKKILLPTDEES